jgi:hypothetical protein
MAVTGQRERQRERQLRRAIGDRLASGQQRLDAGALAAEVGVPERAVGYLIRRAARRRGLTVRELPGEQRVWEVV